MELQNYLTITTPDAMNAMSDQSTPHPLVIGSRHSQFVGRKCGEEGQGGCDAWGSLPSKGWERTHAVRAAAQVKSVIVRR
jgi:hypothetical protein